MEVALGLLTGFSKALARRFQSLFSWKSPSDFKSLIAAVEKYKFQSLFSWKSPSDSNRERKRQLERLFQSLFSWKSPSDAKSDACKFPEAEVSILVFVEVALGHHRDR